MGAEKIFEVRLKPFCLCFGFDLCLVCVFWLCFGGVDVFLYVV